MFRMCIGTLLKTTHVEQDLSRGWVNTTTGESLLKYEWQLKVETTQKPMGTMGLFPLSLQK